MASSCVDRRDQVYINQQLIGDGPTLNADGSYTIHQVDVFAQQLIDNIVAESDNNPITKAVNKFGDGFYNAVNYINGNLRNYDSSNFPSLNNRWDRGNVSTIEVADFIEAYNYTPNGIQNQTPNKLLSDLDGYYKGGIYENALSGFCNSMNNLFNQIDAFYDLIGVVDGLIQDAQAIYKKFLALKGKYEGQTPLEIIEEEIVKALMREIKEKILGAIREIYNKVMDAINNFDILGEIEDLVTAIDKKHTKYIMTRKERMCNEFTEEAQKSVEDRVKGFMDYAFGLFENMDLTTMQFLVARFCALAANIEALVNEIKNPLDVYSNRYQRVVQRLQALSGANTSTAIRNGAIRFSPEKRQDAINRLQGLYDDGERLTTSTGEASVNVQPITAAEYKDLPKCMAVFKGTDDRLKLEGDIFDEKKGIGIPAYTHIDLDVKVYLMRLHSFYNTQFTITNGWLSKKYVNEKKLSKDDAHLSGLVIDIKNEGFNDIELLTERAIASGFKYVVVYDTHIHLDIRDIPR